MTVNLAVTCGDAASTPSASVHSPRGSLFLPTLGAGGDLLAARRDGGVLRSALARWAFAMRSSEDVPPDEVADALAWLERNTRDIGDLAEPGVARAVLDGLGLTKGGHLAAPSTVQRQRGVLVNPAEYAVERRLMIENPITALPRKAPKVAQAVDRRVVVNPDQARTLLRRGCRRDAQRGPARGVLRGQVLRRIAAC